MDAHQTAMWRAMVAGNYFTIPAGQCQSCMNAREVCGKFFCTDCRVSNLCGATFRDGGAHGQHPSAGIRVWKVTHSFALWIEDVRRFMPQHIADRLQLYMQNNRLNVKLRKPDLGTMNNNNRFGRRRLCTGPCGDVISNSSVPNLSAHPVCSVQCLLDDLDAGAEVVVPGAVRDADAMAWRRVAGLPNMMNAREAEERGRVPDANVQGGNVKRRNRRKPNKESVRRSHIANHEFIPQPD